VPQRSGQWSSQLTTNTRLRTYRFATLVAHEIGHNFGATHIDTTSSCELTIMQSGPGATTTFCEFSRNQIANHAANNSACLSSTPSNCDYVLSATGQALPKMPQRAPLTLPREVDVIGWLQVTSVGSVLPAPEILIAPVISTGTAVLRSLTRSSRTQATCVEER
jgi:hypothetical protein